MTRIRRGRGAALLVAGSLMAVAAAVVGCRDRIADPTQGRIALTVLGATDVDVFLDGQFVGTDPDGLLGPFPPGRYEVSVIRQCFDEQAAEVTVRAGGISDVEFRLVPRDFGSVDVRAFDELSGAEIVGAEILREVQPATFVTTGVTTPGTVSDLPCGPMRLRVSLPPDYADSAPVDVLVDTDVVAQADLTIGPPAAALAEMFTYVICPNCPQAAAELKSIHEAHPREVYLIEWHTWSGLPLYTPEGEAREEYYLGTSQPGWPLVVFQGDGDNWLLGSQSGTLAEYWNRVDAVRQACSNDCPIILSTESAIGGGRADVTARAKVRSGSAPGGVTLRWVLVEDTVLAPGNQPEGFDAVPRAVHEQAVTLAPAGQVAEWSHGIALDPAWVEGNLGWVVFLQTDADKKVLAVHGTH